MHVAHVWETPLNLSMVKTFNGCYLKLCVHIYDCPPQTSYIKYYYYYYEK